MREAEEIQHDISSTVRDIVVLMRKDRELPLEKLKTVIDYLKEYRIYSRTQDVIPKKMAYELFYLFTCVTSQLNYNKEKEELVDSFNSAELYMTIMSVFNEGLYQ